jgi:NAD/NADP transhydrogenase beta subunit
MTFSGSLVAFGKLQGLMGSRPLQYALRDKVNAGLAGGSVAALGWALSDVASADVGTAALLGSTAMATALGWQLTAGVVRGPGGGGGGTCGSSEPIDAPTRGYMP